MDALAAATKDSKSLDQVEAQLNEMNIKFNRGTATLDSATLPPEMLKALDARKPDDMFFIRSRGSGSYFKVMSVDSKPLTGDEANEFAKREVRAQIARKSAQDISQAALATTKYEGDYARIMTTPAPGGAAPAARRRRGAVRRGAGTRKTGRGDRQGSAKKLIRLSQGDPA